MRNNNPGNLRKSDIQWRGKVDGDDKEFETFERPAFGIRAIVRVLRTYRRRGRWSIREMITTYAPPSENNTEAYINAVAQAVGKDPDNALNLHKFDEVVAFVKAIIKHENGVQPYPDEVIETGVRMGLA